MKQQETNKIPDWREGLKNAVKDDLELKIQVSQFERCLC